MINGTLRGRVAKVAAVGAALAVGASALLVATTGSAGADPKQQAALVGVGSDTIQDVMNAYAGENNGINYTPVQSSSATGQRQIISFDATDPAGVDNCITTKVKAPTIYRANGSGSGRNALSRALLGGTFGLAGQCGGPKSVGGLIDFARSSSVGGTGTALTYVPFGRDFVGLAYYYKDPVSGNPVNGNLSLTKAQITTLYSTSTVSPATPLTLAGLGVTGGALGGFAGTTPVAPCGIQTGSGTYSFFNNTFLGGTTGSDQNATSFCRLLAGGNVGTAAGGPGRLQESDGAALKAKGDASPGTLVVIPYSSANFIAQSNGVAKSQLGAGVDFVNFSDVVSNTAAQRLPYSGTAPNLSIVQTYYSSASGRDVFNVFDSGTFDPLFPSANQDVKTLFTTPGAGLCSTAAQNTRAAFGFGASVLPCGDTSTTSAAGTGTS